MTTLTLEGWKSSTTTLLVSSLPLQTFDEGLLLVDSYLSSVGGWVPNDTNDPTGDGFPANGASPTQAVADISQSRYDRVHRLRATMNVELNLDFISNFDPGQSDEEIIAQMQPLILAFVREQFEKSPLDFSDLTELQGTLTVGGVQTPEQRRDINQSIADGKTKRDPRVAALTAARATYFLEDVWNVFSIYLEPDKPIVAIIRKYTNVTYETLDENETRQYVLTVSPDTYNITGGTIGTVDQ